MSQLFAWGANSHGQLGLGLQSEQSIVPEVVINLDKINLKEIDIKKIVGGAGHTIIVDVAGRLYACGWNKRGQTGIPGSDVILNFQTMNKLMNERIIDVACGWDSSMALNDNGEVYGWGSNCYGQLGTREKVLEGSCEPRKIHFNTRIRRIAMGLRHSAVVTEDGRVFTAGAGSKGQLGLVDDKNKSLKGTNIFTLVPGIQEVIDVSCGQYHTMALTKNGDIFTWGDNKYGQLGVDCNKMTSSTVPIKLREHFGAVKMIATGWTHSSILTENGRIISWGRGAYGQLGCSNKERPSWEPRAVENIGKIRQLSVGSEHNVALDENGSIFSWGWNEHGNCGNGSTENVVVPEEILIYQQQKNDKIRIGSGAAHSFAVVTTR